nr:LOW QUALITY PROTEIN: calmodulin-binding transcription activator 1-like [Chelonoidis abingdonii]
MSKRQGSGTGLWFWSGTGSGCSCCLTPRPRPSINQFRMAILERTGKMEMRMQEMTASSQQQRRRCRRPHRTQAASDSFEERIVALCEKMMSRSSWLHSDTLVHDISFRGMTLLHLAAAQGYARLIETLIKWRNLSAESLDLEQEVDPLNVDHFSCTPLMWACALGHLDAALLLYRWNGRALSIPDSLGRLPLAVACSRGHVALAARLEELQRQEPSPEGAADKGWEPPRPAEGLRIPSPPSASPDTGLSTVSSVSSPSELSDGSGSGSVTSAYSSASALRDSPAGSPEPEAAMDFGPSPEGWYLQDPPSPPGLRCSPRFFMDYEGPPERELLAYGENAENEGYLPATDVLQVVRAGGLGARTPGFSPRRWEGSWGWWVRAGGAGSQDSWVLSPALGSPADPAAPPQYALYKKMTQAAILIQSKFRSYYEQKKFQQSRRAAVLIQQYYRSYKEYEKLKQGHRASAAMQQKMKGTFLTKKQDQAARKIMRFLRRCRHRMKELKQSKEVESLQKRGLAT